MALGRGEDGDYSLVERGRRLAVGDDIGGECSDLNGVADGAGAESDVPGPNSGTVMARRLVP